MDSDIYLPWIFYGDKTLIPESVSRPSTMSPEQPVCVWCMLKRKTKILQVYLLLLYYPRAVQQRISPFSSHVGGRNVIIVAFSAEKLLKALPFLGTMVCDFL